MKNRFESVELVNYTRGEEILNVLTHFSGLAIPLFMFIRCLPLCKGEVFPLVCLILYCIGNAMCFTASVCYHAAKHGFVRKLLRVTDHSAIFFAVAGTVTGCVPIVYERGSASGAVLMLVMCWGSVAAGLVLTIFFFGKFKNVRMAMYIITSAVCALIGAPTYKALPGGAFACIIVGGIVLLIGCVLYKLGAKRRYIHSLFHIFIVAGLGIYGYGIYNYVYLLL